jgi:hypothetical protein
VKNVTIAEEILSAAQNNAQGQARIALTAALDDTPGWYDPLSPEPSPTDYAAQEANQYLWLANIDFPFCFRPPRGTRRACGRQRVMEQWN